MDLLRMLVLVLVLVCSEAQEVTEVRAELGQDATLSCSIRKKEDIFWYLEVYSQLRASIGRTYSSFPEYFSPEVQTKYSILENRLVIKNVSAEDCRLYFCAEEIKGTFVFVDTFRLVSDVPVAPSNNSNQHNQSCTSSSSTCQNEHVMLGSFVLNAVLVSVVTGWMCSYLMRNQENQENQEDQELMGSPQEEETLPLFPAHLLSECIYYRGERHHLKLDRC
ncbi:uncharacterized protein LOC142391297 isoform X1 [Odontesthes bonariensis]|uniref:uncharacterized protein LOC142391297 isoform X1 n=1 Tax=Odontesthes bonariensis TaxID=219752 RepID=UPI003F58B156